MIPAQEIPPSADPRSHPGPDHPPHTPTIPLPPAAPGPPPGSDYVMYASPPHMSVPYPHGHGYAPPPPHHRSPEHYPGATMHPGLPPHTYPPSVPGLPHGVAPPHVVPFMRQPSSVASPAASMPQLRHRQIISCHPCRLRKVKCSGGKPCEACVKIKRTSECRYEKTVRRRGKGKKGLQTDAEWQESGGKDDDDDGYGDDGGGEGEGTSVAESSRSEHDRSDRHNDDTPSGSGGRRTVQDGSPAGSAARRNSTTSSFAPSDHDPSSSTPNRRRVRLDRDDARDLKRPKVDEERPESRSRERRSQLESQRSLPSPPASSLRRGHHDHDMRR